MAYWAQHGSTPYVAIEFGTPLDCSFFRSRKHGGWGAPEEGGAMVSEPLLTEYSAIYLGDAAYRQESNWYRQQIPKNFLREQMYRKQDKLYSIEENLQAIQEMFIRNTWRSYRTLGFTAALPWAMAHGLENQGEAELFRKNIAMPSFNPGRRGAYLPELRNGRLFHLQPDKAGLTPNPSLYALKAVLGDSLAWISGPERLPYPVSPVPAGAKAPVGSAPPAFMSKDHHFLVGVSIAKQVVLINDAREAQPFAYTWNLTVDGGILASGSDQGSLAPASTSFIPIVAQLPLKLTSNKGKGVIKLTATIGGRKHVDSFSFTVFPTPTAVSVTLLIHDPEGDSSRLLQGLGASLQPWDGRPSTTPLVIGRRALSNGPLPGDLAAFVRSGGRVLILAQDPEFCRTQLGLRVNRQASRRIFPVGFAHPITAGITAEDLRDWRGEGTLTAPYPETEDRTVAPLYGWKWGNRGTVASSTIEKPHHAGWRPLLQGEFDQAYTPLMELSLGTGYALWCTLDLEGRTAQDPVADLLARKIVSYLAKVVPPSPRGVTYVGDGTRKPLLASMGVQFTASAEPAAVLIADQGTEPATVRAAAKRGSTVIVLAQTAASSLAPVARELQALPDSTPPSWPEMRGLSLSDLHWRAPADAWLLTATPGVELAAGGQLGRERVGSGKIIYAQLDPQRFPADDQTYYRFTRWRQTRALAQILANVGVAFANDARAFSPAPVVVRELPRLSLAGPWKLQVTTRMSGLDPREATPDPGISPAARTLIANQSTAGLPGWLSATVPGAWEASGGEFAKLDGEVVYQREVDLPSSVAGRPLPVNLGKLDDFDDVFWDGQPLGRTDVSVANAWSVKRTYTVPAAQATPGRHVLTVRIFDRGGDGGFTGGAEDLFIPLPAAETAPDLYHADYRADFELGDDPARFKRW